MDVIVTFRNVPESVLDQVGRTDRYNVWPDDPDERQAQFLADHEARMRRVDKAIAGVRRKPV
jgi:hypothetical protein